MIDSEMIRARFGPSLLMVPVGPEVVESKLLETTGNPAREFPLV